MLIVIRVARLPLAPPEQASVALGLGLPVRMTGNYSETVDFQTPLSFEGFGDNVSLIVTMIFFCD
jgi:hypothetical protein